MKISILLPYKENFSPEYAGAVSLFVKDTSKISSFKNDIIVFGNTNYKKGFNIKYHNLNLKRKFLNSTSKLYVQSFLDIETKYNSNLIEIHNRPLYVKHIRNKINTDLSSLSSADSLDNVDFEISNSGKQVSFAFTGVKKTKKNAIKNLPIILFIPECFNFYKIDLNLNTSLCKE